MRNKQSLNGSWKFQIDAKEAGDREVWFRTGLPAPNEIEVPHIWQTDENYVNYCGTAWYEKEFEMAPPSDGKEIYLGFGAVDFLAEIWLNGQFIGDHEGGFTPFEFKITGALKEGKNRLTVRVYDPSDNAEIPIGKQGSWYTRISGIWQEVFLESRSSQYIRHVHITPDIDREQITAELKIEEFSGELTAEYIISDHEQPETQQTVHTETIASAKHQAVLPIEQMKLWSPQTPHLYDLTVKIKADGKTVDEYRTYFGMRKIEFSKGKLLLNNQPLYIRGALDQSYYPKTIYTAPSEEWIKKEITMAKDMGFNLLRKHIKAEIPEYLYWADRMGMLIWEEPPNVIKWTEQSRKRFYSELLAMIDRDFNHPSIIIWSLYNEEWGLEWDLANDRDKQAYVKEMYSRIKVLDPSRLICDNSGWIHVETDINDYHRYFTTPEQIKDWEKDLDEYILENTSDNFVDGVNEEGQPIIVSEFGVWGLPSIEKLQDYYGGNPPWFENLGDDTHREDFKQPLNAAKNFEICQLDRVFGDFETLAEHSQARMYRSVKSLIEEMRKRPGINGYVITEFTDVEWETNGWLDYTREMKAGFESAKNFNGSLVIMADRIKRNLWSGEEQTADIIIANDDQADLKGASIRWAIEGTAISGEIVLDNSSSHLILTDAIRFTAPDTAKAGFYTLKLELYSEGKRMAVNEEELTVSPVKQNTPLEVYPYRMDPEFCRQLQGNGIKTAEGFESAELVVTSTLDKAVLDAYRNGKSVVFLAEEGDRLKEKGQFTFRELRRGEDWDRTSSFNFVDPAYFPGIPLRPEMGWEAEGLFPDYIVPFSNYNKLGGTMGRIVYMFGNDNITETSEIISGYFQGWIGQAGGSMLVKKNEQGSLTLTTWKLIDTYGKHPIATQVLHELIQKAAKQTI